MRSISRVADVSINTVSKLLVEAGEAALAIHDETVRNVKASRIQCDEIWSFCYAKEALEFESLEGCQIKKGFVVEQSNQKPRKTHSPNG